MRGDGDGWVHCADGQRRWGRFGAAGLLLRAPGPSDEPVLLLQHRAAWTHQGDCWGLPGGARDSGESAADTAVREAGEEAGIDPVRIRVIGQHAAYPASDTWSFTTVVADAAEPLPVTANQESAELRWVGESEIAGLNLHPELAASWPALRTRPVTLVLDAANVVGSVPDGWWRDRAGAAERLLRQLAATLPCTLVLPDGYGWVRRCIVVLEGRASAAPDVPGVHVVRARGSGDDTVVQVVRAEPDCVVVTADRGLRARLFAGAGTTTRGPSVTGPSVGPSVSGPSVLGPSALLTRLALVHEQQT
ncbi:MAG: NUDIX domain-containing protein [Actinomycetota bacterium]|nr:NUDIX domain-containing protein [Actinomycetota bacterium]